MFYVHNSVKTEFFNVLRRKKCTFIDDVTETSDDCRMLSGFFFFFFRLISEGQRGSESLERESRERVESESLERESFERVSRERESRGDLESLESHGSHGSHESHSERVTSGQCHDLQASQKGRSSI